jgi:hypothetical protein
MRYHIVTTQMMRVVRKTQTKALFYAILFGYLRFFLYLCRLFDIICGKR